MFLYPFAFDPAFFIIFMHPFSGPALFSLKKIAGSLTFIVLFHVCGLCVRISVELIVKCLFLCCGFKCGSRGGGDRGSGSPWKVTSYMVSTGN